MSGLFIALLALLAIIIVAAVAYKMGDTKGKHGCTGGSPGGPCPPARRRRAP